MLVMYAGTWWVYTALVGFNDMSAKANDLAHGLQKYLFWLGLS